MSSSNFSISCLLRWPRQPSDRIVMGAWISMPCMKVSFSLPSRSTPMSPIMTPPTSPFSVKRISEAAYPGKISTSSASAWGAIHAHIAPSETIKFPWFFCCGGVGSRRLPCWLRSQISSLSTGIQVGGGFSRQPGSSSSRGPGSMTAPDRMWAPISALFSITATISSGFSCFRRMAQDSPAGPAPTMMTSYSMTSRSVIADFRLDLWFVKHFIISA